MRTKQLNLEQIVKDLQADGREPGRFNLSLDKGVYGEFQKNCKKERVTVSALVERFMRAFNEKRRK